MRVHCTYSTSSYFLLEILFNLGNQWPEATVKAPMQREVDRQKLSSLYKIIIIMHKAHAYVCTTGEGSSLPERISVSKRIHTDRQDGA